MPRIIQQTALAATQFDGTANQGLWQFDQYDQLPRTTGIAIEFCSYIDTGGGQGLTLTFYAAPFGGATPLERVILGRSDDASMLNPQNSQHEAKFCGIMLPRDTGGRWWQIEAYTDSKDQNGVASIQFRIFPQPESVPGDSP